jgi:hypothetical protein
MPWSVPAVAMPSGSVAADHVASSRDLRLAVGMPQPHRDARFILAQRCQFAAVFDSDAEPAEMAREHSLRLGLRHAELAVRQIGEHLLGIAEAAVDDRPAADEP